MRNTYLSKFYWKLKQRCGAKKAIIALARKILVIVYHILKNHTIYDESKFEAAKQKQEFSRIKKIKADVRKLGFEFIPIPHAS